MLEVLLQRRAATAESDKLSRHEKIHFLQHLAFDLMSDGKEVIGEDDLLIRIESWLANANQRLRDILPEIVLAILVEKDGILANASVHSFRFMHLTLQEYLAARHLAELKDWTKVVVSRSHDPRWEEVLRLMAGILGDEDADRLVGLLWSTDPPGRPKSSLQQRLLAARCASDSRQITPATLRILTTELLQHVFGQGVEPVVNDAITALASLCSTRPAALDSVQEFIHQQYEDTLPLFALFRYVQLLDLTASNVTTEELLRLLGFCLAEAGQNEAQTLLAGNILTGLGHSGELTLIPQLAALLSNQSSHIAASAATALIDLKDEHIEAVLHNYLEYLNNYVRVLAAAVSYRSSGVEALRAMLRRVFCERPDALLQLTACQTVDADSLEPSAEFVTVLLGDCAGDEDKARLLNLTWLLAFLEDSGFIELMIFDHTRPVIQRCSALEAFLQLQPWRAEEVLVRLIDMQDATLTRACLAVLGRSGNTGAHSVLLERVSLSSDEWLLRATINLFSQTWAPPTWGWLMEILRSSPPASDIHLLSLSALAFQRNDAIIPYLRSYLDLWSPADIRERITVYQALARLGTETACDLVVSRLFEESDVAVITHAIEALGNMGLPGAEETLLVCLSPARWPVNWPAPAPPLKQGEQRPSDRRCLAAIIGLNKLGSISALGLLRAIIDDPDEADEVRQAAYIAVRTIGWKVGNWEGEFAAERQPQMGRRRQWFTRRQN